MLKEKKHLLRKIILSSMKFTRLFVIFFLLIVIFYPAFSQKQTKPIEVLNKEIVFNHNVFATEYVFPKDIFWTYYDTTKNLLTILTRQVNKGEYAYKSKGELLVYDLIENKIMWQMPFNFKKMSVSQSDSLLLVQKDYINRQVNTSTGIETGWVTNYNLVLTNNKYKIGLFECCYNKDSNSLVLKGINLESGKEIWKKKVYAKYGYNKVIKQNDSTYIFNLDGIRSINILDGKGWYYAGIIGDESYKTSNIISGIGILFGVATGMLFYAYGADIAYGIHSNIYIDSTATYFATKNKMYCIDSNGFIKWEKDMPLDKMSKSIITVNGNYLQLVNLGIAFNNGSKIKYGEPFIAKYDLSTGNEFSFNVNEIRKTKLKEINSIYPYQDTFLIIRNNEIEKYSYSSALPIKVAELDKRIEENMIEVIDNNINYLKVNQKFISLCEINNSRFNILTDSANVFQFDFELNLTNQYKKQDHFRLFRVYKDFKLLLSENIMVIVNDKGELISEVDISKPIMTNSGLLLSIYRNKMLKYNLDKINNDN